MAARRGAALAISLPPLKFLAKRWKVLLPKLCGACAIEENPEERDAEARANAVNTLSTTFCKQLHTQLNQKINCLDDSEFNSPLP